MKKFILLDHEPWTIRRKQLFYDLFDRTGIQLYVWDISNWLHPGFHNPDEIQNTYYLKKIESEKQFVESLKFESPEHTIIVEEVHRNWVNRKVFKYLSILGFNTIKIDFYGNTVLQQSLLKRITNITFRRIPKILNERFISYLFKIYNTYYHIGKPSRLISSSRTINPTDVINHPDFERYRFHDHQQIVSGDYIVFSDNYFPLHTDNIYFRKLKRLPDAEKYQAKMREYFDYLEYKYNMPVVIAAHPKSDYKGKEFGNRKIIKYKTDDLMAYAKMVTLHTSNTISYALLWDKPIAFVSTDDYQKIIRNKRTLELLAKETLGLTYYNLDKINFEDITFTKVNPKIRQKYIYNYLTSSETENVRNEISISNILKEM